MVGCVSTPPQNEPPPGAQATAETESGGLTDVIFVVPPQGAPQQTGLILADAIAAEIRDGSHPAILAYDPNQSGASVVGEVMSADQHGNVMWLTIEWSVRAPYGTHVATYRQQVVIDRKMWETAAPEAVNLLIGDAAPRILDMVDTHVGPPVYAAMKAYGVAADDGAMDKQSPPPAMAEAVDVEQRPEPAQPLARIADATNGQVVRPEGSPIPPVEAEVADVTSAQAPVDQEIAERPSISEANVPAPEAAPTSGPPVALEPGARVVSPPPGGVAEETETSFLDALTPGTDADARRAGDARPEQPGGFSQIRWGRPAFLIRPVVGAPGNGNQALTAALKTALRDRDLTISEDPRQAGFIIDGRVDLGSPVNGRQYVKIVWAVNTVTGDEVGKAVQENTIVAGSLDGEWGQVAEVVSNAAVRGIQDLFGEADDRLQDREQLPEFPDVDLPSIPGRAPPPPSSY